MLNYRKYIHSSAAIFAFEAAARHQSFTKAAQELHVSQPAVSQAVRQIEVALGVELFHRRHRAIVLTDAGERFYNDVSFGLKRILRSAERLVAEGVEGHVTLSVSTAFAHYWMVPRLAEFRANNPDIEIRLQTTDRDIEIPDNSSSLGVRRGLGKWDGYHSHLLAREEIFPICSPSFLAHAQPPGSLEELAKAKLIHLDEPFRPRPTWQSWFRFHGFDYRDPGDGLRLNDYALVVQAAMAGEGIALGWRHIVELLIEQGFLVKASDMSYTEENHFFVIWPKSSALTPQSERLLEWLKLHGDEGKFSR
jgi:DNA-binding transcriptional LysR family regulator